MTSVDLRLYTVLSRRSFQATVYGALILTLVLSVVFLALGKETVSQGICLLFASLVFAVIYATAMVRFHLLCTRRDRKRT